MFPGAYVISRDEMLSSGMKCYHLEPMLSSGDEMLPSGANVIIWSLCYHLVIMLSPGANVIIWSLCYHLEPMLSFGMKCYHLGLILSSGANVIIWDEMLSSGANIIIWN
jgi:hypothetical protein